MHGPRMHGRAQDAATIRKRVAKMAKSGRVTPEEADRVFRATSPDELDGAVREIRVRHVRAHLAADVQAGRLTKDEADHFLQRLQRGEDVRPPPRFRRRKPPQEPLLLPPTRAERLSDVAREMPKLWSDTIDAHRREVRDAILDTTAALAEKGLLSVTMSQIAEQAGIGRATLYK